MISRRMLREVAPTTRKVGVGALSETQAEAVGTAIVLAGAGLAAVAWTNGFVIAALLTGVAATYGGIAAATKLGESEAT